MKDWLSAFRLRSLPLALTCILMGSFLAQAKGLFRIEITLLGILTAALLQILSNLANDYGDSVSGVDSPERVGPSRAVQTGKITANAMKNAIFVFSGLSFLSGISLLLVAFWGSEKLFQNFVIFLGIGILAILAAIFYTNGKKPYGYVGLGDIAVLIFFGWVGVMGIFFLHTGTFEVLFMLPATSCGLFAVAVLNVNNIRDIPSDALAGKNSIPVRLGRKNAVFYHWSLLISGLVCTCIYVATNFHSFWQLLFLVSVPLMFINAVAVKNKTLASDLDPYLKQMAISALVFTVTFGLGMIL